MNIVASKVVAAPEGQAKTIQVTLELDESELDAIIHALQVAFYEGESFAPWRKTSVDFARLLRKLAIQSL